MPVTINPEPLFLKLNKEVADQLSDDIFSQPYTIDYDGSNSLKIDFGHSGPVTFYDGDGNNSLEESVTIKGPGTFVFKVKVDNDVVNRAPLGSHPFQASIKTTEEIPAVEGLTYYELEVVPSVVNENPQTARITFTSEELHVVPEVILREVVLDDSGVVLKKEVWPDGGFKVNSPYGTVEPYIKRSRFSFNPAVDRLFDRQVTPESDEDKVDVSTTRVGERLRLSFRNKVGPALDVAYIVTPDASRYVDASGRPVEVEIYLNSSQENGVGTADDPNNLRNITVPATSNTDATFSTYSTEREEEARSGEPDV